MKKMISRMVMLALLLALCACGSTAAPSASPPTPAPAEAADAAAPTHYIGNVNTHKFHLPDCSRLPAEKNRVTLDSYDDAVSQGYEACKICLN